MKHVWDEHLRELDKLLETVAEHREMIVCVGERFTGADDEEEQVAAKLVSLSLKSVRDACEEYLRNMPE
nr:hypothetical protein [uncultured Stomatobaculum sp.]